MLRVPLSRLLDASRAGSLWSDADMMGWHPVRGVLGFTLPRRLSQEALAPLVASIDRLARERRGPRELVLDASRLESEGLDGATLAAFRRGVLSPLLEHPTRVSRLLVVAGDGLAQSAIAGSVVLARPPFAVELHPSLDAALRRLQPRASWTSELLGAVHSELTPLGLVSRVRAVIGEEPGVSLRGAARRLSVAPRTLQRALSSAATTFADERLDVRLELAASRLRRSEQKVSAIAAEVGYASLPHFFTMFKNRFGVSPRVFRVRSQRSPA